MNNRIVTLLMLIGSLAADVEGANVYIRDGGTGAGTSWTDALDQVPAALVRGNIYYVADGTYNGFNINTAASGTQTITFRKATEADHGTSTGWLSSYGDGVATFTGTGIGIQQPYIIIDGVSEYGFEIAVNDGENGVTLWATSGTDQPGIQIKYCDIHGIHTMPHNFTNAQECRSIYVHPWSGSVYANTLGLLISHCKMHAVPTMMQVVQCQDMIVEYCLIFDNRVVDATYDPATMAHPNMLFLENSNRTTFRFNEIHDTVAQGFYPAYSGAGFFVYGNYWHDVPGFALFMFDPGSYSNARIYNNTFYKCNWSPIWDNNNTTDAIAQNNLFYQNNDSPNWGGFAHDYSWTDAAIGSEAHGIVAAGTNPFTTPPVISGTISSTMPRNKGNTLASPYNVDAAGTIRGADGSFDIGYYEFPGADIVAPTLTSATVSPTGTQMVLVFSETVQVGAGGSGGWTVTMTNGAVTLGSASVSGSTITYTCSRTINGTESGTIRYTQPGNGIQDPAGNLLVTIPVGSALPVVNNSTQGRVATPAISPGTGPYFGTVSVTITDADTATGAAIHYTIDGSTPTGASPTYSGAFPVTTATTVRAIATKAGSADSFEATQQQYEVGSWVISPAWKTFTVPTQNGTFTWSFRASVDTAGSNTVFGLGPGAVSAYTGMGPIVRFNPTGSIDANDGNIGDYHAANVVTYTLGTNYDFVVTINVVTKKYSVSVTPQGGSSTVIATNWAFRAEQMGASQLNSFGAFAINGTATVTNMSFSVADVTAPQVTAASIDTLGTSLTLTFNEPVSLTSSGGLTLSATPGGALTVTGTTGPTTNTITLVYTLSRTVLVNETVTRSYSKVNGIEDLAGNDLGNFTNATVINGSTQGVGPASTTVTNLRATNVIKH